jgi:hypothetical protein
MWKQEKHEKHLNLNEDVDILIDSSTCIVYIHCCDSGNHGCLYESGANLLRSVLTFSSIICKKRFKLTSQAHNETEPTNVPFLWEVSDEKKFTQWIFVNFWRSEMTYYRSKMLNHSSKK